MHCQPFQISKNDDDDNANSVEAMEGNGLRRSLERRGMDRNVERNVVERGDPGMGVQTDTTARRTNVKCDRGSNGVVCHR